VIRDCTQGKRHMDSVFHPLMPSGDDHLTNDFQMGSLVRQNIICSCRLKYIVGGAWLIFEHFSLRHLIGFTL